MAKTGATQKQLSDYGKHTGVCRFIQNHLVGLEPLIPDPYGMFGCASFARARLGAQDEQHPGRFFAQVYESER